MPKHNTEKGALKSNSSLTLEHKRTTSPFCSRRVIPKSKGFNLDDNTKNKKYHHQEDCYHETTQKKNKKTTNIQIYTFYNNW